MHNIDCSKTPDKAICKRLEVLKMQVVKVLGESTQVNAGSGSSVPGSVNGILGAAIGAEYVMLQHSHSSDRLVEIRTGAGVTYGSIHGRKRSNYCP